MTTRTARTPVTVPTVTRGCGSPARTVHTAERARAAAQGVGAPVSIARAMRIFGGHSGAVCTRAGTLFLGDSLSRFEFVCEEILCSYMRYCGRLSTLPQPVNVCAK